MLLGYDIWTPYQLETPPAAIVHRIRHEQAPFGGGYDQQDSAAWQVVEH
jgi:hypothetical protein